MKMTNILNKIKKDTLNSSDMIIRNITIDKKTIYIIFNEVLCDGTYINDFLIKSITKINISNNLFLDIYNHLSVNNLVEVKEYKEVLNLLFQGFCLILINNKYLMIEARADLSKGIDTAENEISLIGSNEAFTESYNINLGLIRKRLRTNNLICKSTFLGKYSNTKVGVCYINGIASNELVDAIYEKIKKIDIDGIIDTSYIKEIVLDKESIFPTANLTERPDLVSQALLEGKVIVIVDNTQYAMILPTFFIDYFHTPDDYYQKSFNVTFIRIIRLLAFIISIFGPAYYISVTTHNPEAIPISLLVNFSSQRLGVPFPGFIEAFIMIICFEILRESDARTPAKVGTSISILGGLVLGSAAVEAGIVSPIMIIVIAISTISGLLFTSNALIYSIRYFRLILLILSAFFGLYGVFIGMMILIIKLSSINSFGFPYTAPITPLIPSELRDSIVKLNSKKYRYRNPLLSKKNRIRGKNHEES